MKDYANITTNKRADITLTGMIKPNKPKVFTLLEIEKFACFLEVLTAFCHMSLYKQI